MKERRFVYGFLGTVLAGTALAVLANVLVDPFYRFDLVTAAGVNAQRYEFSSNIRMGKAGAICARKPAIVILGSSRAEVGLNPRAPAFRGATVYNLARPGTGIGEMLDTFRHAVHASPELSQAVIALDFFMFNAHREAVLFGTEVFDFDRQRLLLHPSDTCLDNFREDWQRLVGGKGLVYSFRTLMSQKSDVERNQVDTLEKAAWWMALYDKDGFRGSSYRILEAVALGGLDVGPHVHDDPPRDWVSYQAWGDLHVKAGAYAKAIEDFSQALKGSPPNAALYFRRGSARQQLGDFEAAIQDYRLGLGIEPDNSVLKQLVESAERKEVSSSRRILFEGDNAGQEIEYVKRIWRSGKEHRYCFQKPGQPDTLEVFRDMLRFARNSRIDVRFVINPEHARMLIALQETGLWPQYEDWKRNLVRVLVEEASDAKAPPFPIWDFSGFNTITTEKSPPLSRPHELARWFWEPAHFREEAGTLMLSKVMQNSSEATVGADGFGILLSSSNVDDWLVRTREAGLRYRATHADEVAVLKSRLAPVFADDWTGANCGDEAKAVSNGALALKDGDLAAAEQAFQVARQLAERNQQRSKDLGVPYREPDIDSLITDARAGRMADEPLDNWQAYQERANAKLARGDVSGAIMDLTAALRDSPPNPALFFLRGSAKLRLKDWNGGAADFEAGLRLDPGNEPLKALLRQAKLAAGDSMGQEATSGTKSR